jgi:hypothetical protein
MLEENDVDYIGRRMHMTPRSAIANLVEDLRAQGWEIDLEEEESGAVTIFAESCSATEDWA